MLYDSCYVSANCNQFPHIAHWGKNNLICYGSSHAIFIYDLNDGGGRIVNTLYGHKKPVNYVKWIQGAEYENEIISASSDKTIIVWTKKGNTFIPHVLKGHTDVVSPIDGLYINKESGHTIICSASADGTVKIWLRDTFDGDFHLHQSIDLGLNICIALRITFLPNSDKLLLASAIDRANVQLYINDGENDEFCKKADLVGHEDWVRDIDFKFEENGNFTIATCSQDAYIRLWKVLDPRNYDKNATDSYRRDLLDTPNGSYLITKESIITGHEGWIYAISWSPNGNQILSASLDKTMIIWELNEDAKIWLESVRVGEVGGNTLGFYGGMFSPDGKGILAHGYQGAFHIWKLDEATSFWHPQVTIGGHFDEVVDLAWEPNGNFLMSVGYDQTTRIHAAWRKNDEDVITWHEIARPQVHGYDMACLAIFNEYNFASAGDEKVVRIFKAPQNFVENFRRICRLEEDTKYAAPKGASVPSLGLSNKAIYENDNNEDASIKNSKQYYPEESHFTAIDLTEPPTEETLLQNTLWPETQKLYGHGYELYSLAASPNGKFLASSCKATTREHACILLWDTAKWQIVQKLYSHTLTIAQMSFSPDSNHILSVSRDRRWSLFTRNAESGSFDLAASTDSKCGIHTRIIWCCAWTHDSKYFSTGSRDGKVVVWHLNPDKPIENVLQQYEPASDILKTKNESITALAFAPFKCLHQEDDYLLAIGYENGCIHLYKWNVSGFYKLFDISNSNGHHLTVKRLAFRPMIGMALDKRKQNILQLASCSSDCSVRIFNLYLNELCKI